ncbi:hypothetical protein K438DRAFT_1788834 [Mycena galopus ATCC 62051]|nr:hypothetical protein K438DRAFT_1788834 [Mycena galopus ATCC 62051]
MSSLLSWQHFCKILAKRRRLILVFRPQGRKSSKFLCRQVQKKWNDAVDKYIALGVDSRPRVEIEAAAKIGVSLGAMFRICEAEGCEKAEGRNMEQVSVCGRCKMLIEFHRLSTAELPAGNCVGLFTIGRYAPISGADEVGIFGNWSKRAVGGSIAAPKAKQSALVHKKLCGAENQIERPLPSQVATVQFLYDMNTEEA